MQKEKRQCVFAFILCRIVFSILFFSKTPRKIHYMRFCKFASYAMRICIKRKRFSLIRKNSCYIYNILRKQFKIYLVKAKNHSERSIRSFSILNFSNKSLTVRFFFSSPQISTTILPPSIMMRRLPYWMAFFILWVTINVVR